MSEVKNGAIQVASMEVDGVRRTIKSGQVIANDAAMIAKLQRYIKDPRFSEDDRAMYARQLADRTPEGDE